MNASMDIRKGLGVANIEEKIKENRLDGFGMSKDGVLANWKEK